MTKVSSVPKVAFISKHTRANEEDEEEESDMASHSEDPVCPSPWIASCSTIMGPHADYFLKVRHGLHRSP